MRKREGTRLRNAKNSLGSDSLRYNYIALFPNVEQIKSEKGKEYGCLGPWNGQNGPTVNIHDKHPQMEP